MENEEEKNSFLKLVLSIKNEIENYDVKKWEQIVRPEDPGYDEYFNKCIEDQKKEWESGKKREMEITREKKTFDLNASYFEGLSRNEKFFFLLKLKEMMETSWLLAHKRLAGIKSEEESNSLKVDDIIRYSSTLADTTCAPPDYDNVEDKALHLQFYPNYHFLNFINIENIHMSKLFQLQKYSTVCFPPIIYLKEKEGMLTVYIFCTTPKATIYYKINNDTHERIYDRKHKPEIPKRGKVVIYARSTKEGFLNSRVSCYSKTYKGEGGIEKDVLTKPLPTVSPQMLNKAEKSEEGLAKPTLDKSKKAFKHLGFLLNREREKKSNSSSSESSSDDT